MQLDLVAIFLIGLATGFSHCIGMCGPFVLTYTLKLSENSIVVKPTFWQQFYPHLLYNSGRLLTYVFLGQLFGLLGQTLGTVVAFKSFQGGLIIFAGLVMVLMGIQMSGFLPKTQRDTFWGVGKFTSIVQSMLNRVNPNNVFGLGVVLGFLPCGVLYAAFAKAAATQTIWGGGLTMLAFGLGTFPAMILTGVTAHLISSHLRKKLYRIAAIMVILLGLYTMYKGIMKVSGKGLMKHGSHSGQMQMAPEKKQPSIEQMPSENSHSEMEHQAEDHD